MNNQPDQRHHEGGIPLVPIAGIIWLVVVLFVEACCDAPPRQFAPATFGTLRVSK